MNDSILKALVIIKQALIIESLTTPNKVMHDDISNRCSILIKQRQTYVTKYAHIFEDEPTYKETNKQTVDQLMEFISTHIEEEEKQAQAAEDAVATEQTPPAVVNLTPTE